MTEDSYRLRPYLLRLEATCGAVYDRRKRRWWFVTHKQAETWLHRSDVEVIDYCDVTFETDRSVLGAPLMLFLDITARCQCSCWYCYTNSHQERAEEMATADALTLIRRFAELGGAEVRLAGGEPTLHPGLLALIDELELLQLRSIVVSNGLIGDPLLAQLVRHPVSCYYLSLQGDRAVHDATRGSGAYDACLRSARRLIDAGIPVRLSMVFHRHNTHCVEHLVETAAEIGAAVAFNPLRPLGRAGEDQMIEPKEHRRLVERVVALKKRYPDVTITTPWEYLVSPPGPQYQPPYKRIGCGGTGLTVTPTGDFFSCGQLSCERQYCQGNVMEDDLHDVWFRAMASCPLIRASLAPRCQECAYLHGSPCFGGCAVTALKVRGAMEAGDPYCFVNIDKEGIQS